MLRFHQTVVQRLQFLAM